MAVSPVIKTERLDLHFVTKDDATFIYRLVNEKSWIENIGNRNVNSVEEAIPYIKKTFSDNYEKNGYGLYKVCLKDGTAIGLNGLVNRDSLEHVDVGFACLPEYWGKGYSYEAAEAVLKFAEETLGIDYIVAITSPTNVPSQNLLKKLGYQFDKLVPYNEKEDSMYFIPSKQID